MSNGKKSAKDFRDHLTPEQAHICCEKGTEAPFTGEYVDCKDAGVYHCVCCDQALFGSNTKFDSGTGWPSFWAPWSEGNVRSETDLSHGMRRTEVVCASCGSHLGHVFNDGPEPTRLRYCINSLSLRLEKD